MIKFGGKILVVGCGGVSQCALPLILKLIDVPPQNITVLDFVDNKARVKDVLKQGVNYIQEKLTRDNYRELLGRYLGRGDIFVDLAWDIDTCEMLDFCRKNGIHYINTSFELWSAYHGAEGKHPTELTLYARHIKLRKMIAGWGDNAGPTAVIDHGANPGLVSHFTKTGLLDIAANVIRTKPDMVQREEIERAMSDQMFNHLAYLLGVRVIHISEIDTQVSSIAVPQDVFLNTWSVEGLYEEGTSPAELGWGTHERTLPIDACEHQNGAKNQICMKRFGIDTWVKSRVASREIEGMVVRHGEAFTISDALTVWEGDRAIYRPTVHYAYRPSEVTLASLEILRSRNYVMQENWRVLDDEITAGEDELGVLLLGHAFTAWWTGTVLGIDEARALVPHQNATTLQVAASVLAAVFWMIEHPREGVLVPDELPFEPIMEIATPYLGRLPSTALDWTPTGKPATGDATWQFENFLIG